MIDWLLQNKEWLFSGIGVLVLVVVCKLLYARFNRRSLPASTGSATGDSASQVVRSSSAPAVAIQGGTHLASTAVLKKSTVGDLKDWLSATVRIRIGDYYSVQAGGFAVRVEVVDIRMAGIGAEHGRGVKDELVVEVYVSLGGAVVRGGASTVQVSTNKYLVPRFSDDQGLRSLYLLSTDHNWATFFVVSVTHINPHDGCADIMIVKASIAG